MVRAHSLPDMAHFITGAGKAVFEYATICPQEALTVQQSRGSFTQVIVEGATAVLFSFNFGSA